MRNFNGGVEEMSKRKKKDQLPKAEVAEEGTAVVVATESSEVVTADPPTLALGSDVEAAEANYEEFRKEFLELAARGEVLVFPPVIPAPVAPAEVNYEEFNKQFHEMAARGEVLEFAPVIPEPVVAIGEPVVVAPVTVKAEPVVAAPTFSLEAAAPRLIYDYREGWAPAIRIRARMAGVDPDKDHSLAAWRDVFISWGGHGMVR
jgi:hypothetical protein